MKYRADYLAADTRGRVKKPGQNFMDWLDELVQNNPEARAAYEDEMRQYLEQRTAEGRE